MKKINKISFLLVILTIFSCDDFTEFDRGFLITEDGAITDISSLERLLLGTYDANDSYREIIGLNSIASDEVRIGLGNRGQGLQEHSFTLTSNDGNITTAWNSMYDMLDNANRVIRAAESIELNSGEETTRDQIVGEALAIRAWQHFDLLRMYAPSFDPSASGVPISNRVLAFGTDDLNFPRNTVGEVLAQIEQDLIDASNLIPSSANNINRFSLTAIKALQARVALYVGTTESLNEAVNLTTEVLAEVPLVSGTDYIDMFREDPSETPANPTEVILQIERDQFDPRIGTNWTDINGDVFFSMSTDLLSDISNAGSSRQTVNLDLETSINPAEATPDELIVGKYLGTSALSGVNNIKVFRSSEMLLIRAEANAILGNLPAARTDIEALRATRGSSVTTPVAYAGLNEAIADIALERRVELAFEGHRLFDLKRFGLGIARPNDDCSNPTRVSPTTCNLDAGSFRFTFPIPQSEIFANDGIGPEDQNPGY